MRNRGLGACSIGEGGSAETSPVSVLDLRCDRRRARVISESVGALFRGPCVASHDKGARAQDAVGQAQHNHAGSRRSSNVQEYF